jgi:ABC-type sugar transport system ATPase subunit
MISLAVNDLTKRFGSIVAVDQVNFSVNDGELLVIIGASGCGKTTLLRLIAGLEDPDSGTIYVGGVPVNDLPAGKRGVQMIFQNYALWPHMKIFDERKFTNLTFPLKIRKWSKEKIREGVRQIHRNNRLTTLYVTHDLSDALALGDRIGLMRDGRFEQIDSSEVLIQHPANQYVADFFRASGIGAGGPLKRWGVQ